MGFTIENSISIITVFVQGIISFLSPCILPIIPVYLGYLSGIGQTDEETGEVTYPKKQVIGNTIFFVVGIAFAFFLLGISFTTVGQFLNENHILFARISGLIMILFGLYQIGLLGHFKFLEKEYRIGLKLDKLPASPLTTLLLGFTFSFAWTPCIGPVLGSVLIMAGNAETIGTSMFLIAMYTVGFLIPFLFVGVFTTTVLAFFRKYRNIVKYTVKIGGVLMILMGIITFTGYFSTQLPSDDKDKETVEAAESDTQQKTEEETDELLPALDFELYDQYGELHTLADYEGKVIFMNFWATWCPPCRNEMPEIQKIYESYGLNEEDVIVIGVAAPNYANEGSEESIIQFLEENQYSFPVLMDEEGILFKGYGIYSYPTTYMINADGKVYGYASGAMTEDMMKDIIAQTQARP